MSEQDNKQGADSIDSVHNCLFDNFWVAYDALDMNNKHLLDIGIELAK